ncbi:MAG TPA: CDP-diacylglycerol diphosphatase [Geobacteraceae bacterium]
MNRGSAKGVRRVVLGVLLAAGTCLSASACAAPTRGALWATIATCLDPGVADYCGRCATPLVETTCGQGRGCGETTEVWAETREYVAIRDSKMCGCPGEFVHGLAIPRTQVTGVEDPGRPDGIWQFAWNAGRQRIGDETDLALAVNPRRLRSQDQLHVHIVRLLPGARARLAGLAVARVPSLGEVWHAAARSAASAGMKEYGVLVARDPEGGFLVRVEEGSPEKMYTRYRCR